MRIIPAFLHVPDSVDSETAMRAAKNLLEKTNFSITFDEQHPDRMCESHIFDRSSFDQLPKAPSESDDIVSVKKDDGKHAKTLPHELKRI